MFLEVTENITNKQGFNKEHCYSTSNPQCFLGSLCSNQPQMFILEYISV